MKEGRVENMPLVGCMNELNLELSLFPNTPTISSFIHYNPKIVSLSLLHLYLSSTLRIYLTALVEQIPK